jgi:hypothetical protein
VLSLFAVSLVVAVMGCASDEPEGEKSKTSATEKKEPLAASCDLTTDAEGSDAEKYDPPQKAHFKETNDAYVVSFTHVDPEQDDLGRVDITFDIDNSHRLKDLKKYKGASVLASLDPDGTVNIGGISDIELHFDTDNDLSGSFQDGTLTLKLSKSGNDSAKAGLNQWTPQLMYIDEEHADEDDQEEPDPDAEADEEPQDQADTNISFQCSGKVQQPL